MNGDYWMSPKFVNREEKIQAIARAALELFAQKGFSATSVTQIATAAGVGKGTLYEYFETKTDIFVAAIVEWMKQFERTIMAELERIDDPVARLRRLPRSARRSWTPSIPQRPVSPSTFYSIPCSKMAYCTTAAT